MEETLKISSNGQWTLEKSSKISTLAALALANAISPNMSPSSLEPTTPTTQKVVESVNLHPDLSHISHIESSGGRNKNHPKVNYGLNAGDTAAGLVGLMPITIKETISKNPTLNAKYGGLLDKPHNNITSFINSNENVDKEIANAHWNRLMRVFPKDELRRVYAWNNGITGAKKASDEQVKSHPYVQKFINLKYNKIADK